MSSLIPSAETAQDIASGLNKFLERVPEHATEITGLISDCFALSSALRDLHARIHDPRSRGSYVHIQEEARTLLLSLEFTFNDVHRLFGGLGRTNHISVASAYRQVWSEIESYFFEESRNKLSDRLRYYHEFIQRMTRIMVEGSLPDYAIYDDLQDRIEVLLEKQEDRLESDLNNLSLGAPSAAPRQRSFERRRPEGLTPLPPELPRRGVRPEFPASRPVVDPEFHRPPVAPEVPLSPTTTSTFSTLSSSASSSIAHWVAKVFEQSRPTTRFNTTGPVSACYGQDSPSVSNRLAEEYDKVHELSFEEGSLVVRLYVRSRDRRARIYCRSIRSHQSRKQYCLPLTSLRIERDRSSLKLCRTSRNGRPLEVWACLRFLNYERLVLFFCTFLAMKAEDTENDSRSTVDHELRGEKTVFSGTIRDDHYDHVLQVLQDSDSGGIRLQASVRTGELKRKPEWTAFITHQVTSRRWMRKVGSKTIYLADLQPFVFSDDYTPQVESGGEHELYFLQSRDADVFMDAIEDLAADM